MQTDTYRLGELDKIWTHVLDGREFHDSMIHGPNHWARVERNGLYLAERNSADPFIVSLFALFHDSMRHDDGTDPEHGFRGAEYAKKLRGTVYMISDSDFDILYRACRNHTDEMHTDNPTIAACWDADRLDIGRVGFTVMADFMSTEAAALMVADNSFEKTLAEQKLRNTE